MRIFAILLVITFGVAACSSDPTSSDEYQELADQLALSEQELSAVSSQRDSLLADKERAERRFELSNETIDAVGEIVSDPSAFGTEDEVLELLSRYFAPGATTHDLAYGEIETIAGWRNTLFGGQVDAVTTEWHNWVCEDGSQGGSLWTWEGTNFLGQPFELIGVSIQRFNDEGLGTGNTVMWPYPDEYVWQAFGARP
jgi:hypothetical protein